MRGIPALSLIVCYTWFCLLGATLAIMMMQLMCVWSGCSINNSPYCSFLGMCMWHPLILVTGIVQNKEINTLSPSVSSTCSSHHIKIIFIILLMLSDDNLLQSSILCPCFSLPQYQNISYYSMLTIFQEAVKRQNWFTWVPCSICQRIMLFVFRAGHLPGRLDPGKQHTRSSSAKLIGFSFFPFCSSPNLFNFKVSVAGLLLEALGSE